MLDCAQVKGRFAEEASVLRDEAERAREEASRYRQQVPPMPLFIPAYIRRLYW